ncbi:hypothetical protein HJC23_003366 [Cyclotella cryptica]|uniref:Methyltransferase domain-containing protein n=1 Tax=Cyclotella cryptica TaxID=29204 RepID=A0ABD3QY65_9STRA
MKSLPLLLLTLLHLTSPAPTDDLITHHLEQGNAALSTSDFSTAISHYQSCLSLDPQHRYCLVNYASALVDSIIDPTQEDQKTQTFQTAIELLRKVLQLHPNDGDAAFNLAVLLQDTSRSETTTAEAASLYQTSVEASLQNGDHRWDAWANLASARQELGQYLGKYGAHAAYERSIVYLERMTKEHRSYIDRVLHSPNAAEMEWDEERYNEVSAELWQMNVWLSKLYYGLGTVLSELSAQDCLGLMRQDTLLIDAVVEGEDDEGQAKKVCEANALNAMRMAVDLDGNNMVAEHMLKAMVGESDDDGEEKQKRASNEFVSGERFFVVGSSLSIACRQLLCMLCLFYDCHFYSKKLLLSPMLYFVVPKFYPLALFDDFADTFDEKLGALNYKVPSLIGEAAFWLLQQGERSTYRSVLDAGCGTGLAGRFLKPLVDGTLVGVDLSTKMLDVARECTLVKGCGLKEAMGDVEEGADTGSSENEDEPSNEDDRSSVRLYNHLISLDLETATLDDVYSGYIDPPTDAKDGFELIVAADVLVYFGDLQKLLTNFANLSAKSNQERDAFLIFSCERIEEEDAPSTGWKLQISGRYAHSKSYVVKTAKEAGFRLIGYEEIVPRMEKGEEVQGHLFQFAFGLDDDWDEEEVGDIGELVFMDIIDENGQVVRDEL